MRHSETLHRLREELQEIERQLAAVAILQVRQQRVLDAIRSLEALEAPIEEDVADVSLRYIVQTLPPAEPASPVDAARMVLERAGVALHISRIIGAMRYRGWYSLRDHESLRGTIAAALDRDARSGEVLKPSPGTYVLAGPVRWRTPVEGTQNGSRLLRRMDQEGDRS